MITKHGTFGLSQFCLILALVLFFLATVGVILARATPWPWWNSSLVAAGLFFWCLSTAL
jgi:hypothetical protein